jgi:hypothetical protein
MTNVIERVVYNLVGITVAIFVVVYPFPLIMKRVNPKTTSNEIA